MAQQHSHPKKQKWPETQNSESTEGAKWCGRWRLLALGDWQIGQVQVDWKDSWPQLFHSDSSIWSYNPTINIIHLPEAKTSLGFGAESLRKANTIIPLKPFVAWLHFNEKFHPSRFWGQLGPQKTETMSRRPTSTSLWRMRKWPLKKETVNANIATWVWCFPVVFGPLDRSFLFFRCGHSERGPNFVYNTTQPSPVPCSMVPSCFLSETQFWTEVGQHERESSESNSEGLRRWISLHSPLGLSNAGVDTANFHSPTFPIISWYSMTDWNTCGYELSE